MFLDLDDLEEVGIDSLIRIQLIPNPDKQPLIGGSVLTVRMEQASNIFIEEPSLLFVQYTNGSVEQIHSIALMLVELISTFMYEIIILEIQKSGGVRYHRSFRITSDVTAVVVNAAFIVAGSRSTINVVKEFVVKGERYYNYRVH